MTYNAILVAEDGSVTAEMQALDDDRLPEVNVTVTIDYSTLNYKDGLCLGLGGGLVRTIRVFQESISPVRWR